MAIDTGLHGQAGESADTGNAPHVSVTITEPVSEGSGYAEVAEDSEQLARIEAHVAVLPEILAALKHLPISEQLQAKALNAAFPGIPAAKDSRPATETPAVIPSFKMASGVPVQSGFESSTKDSREKIERSMIVESLVSEISAPGESIGAKEKTTSSEASRETTAAISDVAPVVDLSADPEAKGRSPAAGENKPSPTPERGANGRFAPKSKEAQDEQRQAAREKREKAESSKLLEAITSGFSSGGSDEVTDAAGVAAGGAYFQSTKEVLQASMETVSKVSEIKQRISDFREAKAEKAAAKAEKAKAESGAVAKVGIDDSDLPADKTSADSQQVEKSTQILSVMQSSEEQAADAAEEQAKAQESQNDDVITAIKRIPGAGGGDGSGSGILDLFSRKGGGKAGKLFSKVGKFAKGAGAVAAPLAALTAGFMKYDEVKDDASLTGGQKTAQVASTSVGAGGGALAGAALGAAVGSVVPVVGTAIGGLVGGVLGGIGGSAAGEWFGGIVSDWMGDNKEIAGDVLEKSADASIAETPPAPTPDIPAIKLSPTAAQEPGLLANASVLPIAMATPENVQIPAAIADSGRAADIPQPPSTSAETGNLDIPNQPGPKSRTTRTGNDGRTQVSFDEKRLADAISKAMSGAMKNQQSAGSENPLPQINTDFESPLARLVAEDRI